MDKNNVVKEKSYKFALRIIKMYRYMTKEKKEYILSNQLLRSGTSIGANVEEACSGYTKREFIAKLSIAQKEAFETRYWLRLLRDSELVEDRYINSMLDDCEELIRIITKIIVTAKNNIK
ncbi:hypothetical protein Y919_08825 [Caloranaerobacter azorensis H53214]|uniref:Four helix bundle protein n=1 Tax=Caloranaerobacter azorensis H53214 TaxID=1156417 RepID=A0A096BGV1_9FIRM|nr:four helix bundle protein [Caloranaerobacter azorensis]KGG79978.1 hypothetical protein Y919_08825 [Caloranaerobacter azorensis H53214]